MNLNTKEKNKLLQNTLEELLVWCLIGNRNGNPYGKPEVVKALKVVAKLKGIKNYQDAVDDRKPEGA